MAPISSSSSPTYEFIDQCNPGGFNIILAAAALRFLAALRVSGILDGYPKRASQLRDSEDDLEVMVALERSGWENPDCPTASAPITRAALNVFQILTYSLGDPVQAGHPIFRFDARRAPHIMMELSQEVRAKNGSMEGCSQIVKDFAEYSFDVISVIQPNPRDVLFTVMRDLALDVFQFTENTFARCGRE